MKSTLALLLILVSTQVFAQQTSKLYRYVNTANNGHFYTTSWDELGNGKWTFRYERVAAYVYAGAVAGSSPVYRYYNTKTKAHFYTINWEEMGNGKWEFKYESIGFYAFKTQVPGTVPLYRYFNQQRGVHFYTVEWSELGQGKDGFAYESVAAYVFPAEQTSPTASTTPVQEKPQSVPTEVTPDRAKEALAVIHLAFEAWNSANDEHTGPEGYMTDASGKIIGQRFLSFRGPEKYKAILLNWQGKTIPAATVGNTKVDLTWSDGKIATINANGLAEFDYTVHYNDRGEVKDFTCNKLFNNRLQFVRQLAFADGRLSSVTAFENETGSPKPWTRSVKTYTYGNRETAVNFLVYATGRPNEPKNIVSSQTGLYKISDENRFISQAAWGETIEATYNADALLETKKVSRNDRVSEHKYSYVNGKLFKKETVSTEANGAYEKAIEIYFSADRPASVPAEEKSEGTYKFNRDGEMIWEAHGYQYRTKENGRWSEWKNFRM